MIVNGVDIAVLVGSKLHDVLGLEYYHDKGIR